MPHVDKAIESKQTQMFEFQMSVDGSMSYHEARVLANSDHDAMLIIRDVTEQKTAEESRQNSLLLKEIHTVSRTTSRSSGRSQRRCITRPKALVTAPENRPESMARRSAPPAPRGITTAGDRTWAPRLSKVRGIWEGQHAAYPEERSEDAEDDPVIGLVLLLVLFLSVAIDTATLVSAATSGPVTPEQAPMRMAPNHCLEQSRPISLHLPALLTPLPILQTFATSDYLQGTNYGFSIPSGQVITGIQVSISRMSSANFGGNSINDVDLYLLKAGAIVGTNHAVATDWPIAMDVANYGATNDCGEPPGRLRISMTPTSGVSVGI